MLRLTYVHVTSWISSVVTKMLRVLCRSSRIIASQTRGYDYLVERKRQHCDQHLRNKLLLTVSTNSHEQSLALLDEATLTQLGVTSLGHQLAILNASNKRANDYFSTP